MIVGNNKDENIHVVPVPTIDQLADGLRKQLKDGQPPEVPLAMSTGDLASLVHTLQLYVRLAEKVAGVDLEGDEDLNDTIGSCQDEIENLLKAEAPKQSSLVTP